MQHISGIRIAHVCAPEREVRVNRPDPGAGPIAWQRVTRVAGLKMRVGRGASGLEYVLRQGADWQVSVRGRRSEVQIGSARMQDHARALAAMWEQAVASGRIDMAA